MKVVPIRDPRSWGELFARLDRGGPYIDAEGDLYPRRVRPFTPRQWTMLCVGQRDGSFSCAYCGVRLTMPGRGGIEATLDHVIPRALGGGGYFANLVLACRSCNSSKGAR